MPYAPPQKKFFPLEEMVKKVAPHFSYQLQFSSGELEEPTRSKEGIKQFLSALYGGKTPEKELVWDAELGISVERMERILPSRLLSEEVSYSPHPLGLFHLSGGEEAQPVHAIEYCS